MGVKAAESCGLSFTPGTKVLLASGKAVPISSLKSGEKVISTSTKTGKTQAGTITAVLVHHDTNRYDLTLRAHGRTAVIHTTSNHPFWDATTHRWVKAGAFRYGTHPRTPAGGTATVLGGHAPRDRSGWMWDLTIPGDHDFYIATTAADILVHNCNIFTATASDLANSEKVAFSHPVNDEQMYGGEAVGHGGVANLSNEDLVRFGGPNGDDPITAYKTFSHDDPPGEPASDINILAGHHRVTEIANRVRSGRMDPDTPVVIAIGQP